MIHEDIHEYTAECHPATMFRTAPDTRQPAQKILGLSCIPPAPGSDHRSVLPGHDTLAIMATGGGKSLCYQLPALYLGGLTVVISPLIALMKDQVDALNARGIPGCCLEQHARLPTERSRIEVEMREGRLHLLFVSPEKCMQAGFLETLAAAPVRLIAIDEAHCISEWGHHFRPEYRELARIRKLVSRRSRSSPSRRRRPGSPQGYLPAARARPGPRVCREFSTGRTCRTG